MDSFYWLFPFVGLAVGLLCRFSFQLNKIERKINMIQGDSLSKPSAQLQRLKGECCWLTIYNEQNEFTFSKNYFCYILDCDETFVHVLWNYKNSTVDMMVRVSDIIRIHISSQKNTNQ
ncbi:hypothetical protein RBG61_10420 [Paludicola sp. MB14-C6]|uniref:hypothetical protein n=1 Tax=Paludihabitans sp. MB14-C6 TaxID=3070656 RepID=UPI0027DABA2F|nr:hypothetical protein [Paludicola sp. MB14-C6]WMJ22400.1 hypothetical protein RBG61_10420 [Paludicola sp. MB14-C6]